MKRMTMLRYLGLAAILGVACQGPGPGGSTEPVGQAVAGLDSSPVYRDPSGNQNIAQASGTSLTVNDLNQVVYVDGVTYAQTSAGINAAIAAAPAGGTVHLPAGTYALSCGSCGSGVIPINKAITLEGDGWGTVLVPDGSVSTTTDVIHVNVNTTGNPKAGAGIVLRDFAIVPASGLSSAPARYGIIIDTETEYGIPWMVIDHLRIDQLGTAAIGSFDSVQDGFYTSTIQHSLLYGGIALSVLRPSTCYEADGGTVSVATCGAGDLIRIVGNDITGNGWGIDANFESGASSLIVQQNDITSQGGIHLGGNATAVRILENEIEPVTGFATATAAIDVDGYIDATGTAGISRADATLISGNSIQLPATGGVSQDGIRINYASNTTIVDNRFERVTGRNDVVVTSNALNTIIGTNVFLGSGGLALSDSGTGTVTAMASANGFYVGGNPATPAKLDGNGSFFLAAQAACMATGAQDRFVTWSAGIAQDCAQACAAVSCGSAASCVQGWTMYTGTTSYRYGTECSVADPTSGQGPSGKICCCTGSGCAQPMYK